MGITSRFIRQMCGFTLIELMVAVAVIGVATAFAIPTMNDMVKEYRLRSATREMVSRLQELKMTAIKENTNCYMGIDENNEIYTSYIDYDGNGSYDFGELIASIDLKDYGLAIQSSNFQIGANDTLGWDGKGMLTNGNGTIVLQKDATRSKSIIINVAGNIRVQ